MAGDNVISFEQTADGARRRIADAKTRTIVGQCRNQLVDTLPRLLQDLFEHLDDELYTLADKSTSDMVQTTYFEAMRKLRKLRVPIEQAFLRTQLGNFDAFWKGETPQALKPETSEGSLEMSLVDDDVLEEDLAVDSIVSKANNRFHRELFALNMRFAQLLGIPEIGDNENPIAPNRVANAFREALGLWSGEVEVKLVVYKLFDRYLMGFIGGLYDDINDVLVAADVLPKIVQHVRRNPVAPSVQRARNPRQGETGSPDVEGEARGGESADGVAGNGEVLNLLGQLLSSRRGGHLPLPAGFTISSSDEPHLPEVGSADLLGALNDLQHHTLTAAPMDMSDIRQIQMEMAQALGHQLALGTAEHPTARLGSNDQDVMDVMGMLFEFILDDSNLPEAMKALLGRLQIPMLKVAMVDRGFFSNKQHPARRLLNSLARAAMSWVDDGDRSEKSLYGHIESMVTRILTDFTDDIALFEQLGEEFSAYLDRENRGAEVAEERVTQVTRGQEQLQLARQRVDSVLNDYMQGEELPSALVTLLREAWHDVLLLVYLREGEDSQAWKDDCQIVEQLIWSVQPKHEQSERQKLLRAIPDLLKQVREGLVNISFDQHRSATLFKHLQACHIAALRGNRFEDEAQDQALEASSQLPDPIPELEVEEEPVIADQYQQAAETMAVGNWLEWQQDDKWVRGKLSWRSEVTNMCIFVNRKGMKIAEMSVAGVAARLRADAARRLEGINAPLMDKALDAMIVALKRTDHQRPSN